MSNISTRRREGSRTNISGANHDEFLKRITKTLYYGQLPTLPCLSLPVTELSCEVWSAAARGHSLRRLRAAAASRLVRGACVSPCALVLALVYMERLRAHNLRYVRDTPPHHLFLVSLMVGTKFLQDDGEDEEVLCSEWAASGGLELNELKKLEIDFLDAIDWNVYVNEQSFEWQLSWLESEVAARQARARGFYTYSELRAARAQGAALWAALCAAAAAALACVALLGAAAAAAALLRPAPPAPATLHNHTLAPSSPLRAPLDHAMLKDTSLAQRLHVNVHLPTEDILVNEKSYNITLLQWDGTSKVLKNMHLPTEDILVNEKSYNITLLQWDGTSKVLKNMHLPTEDILVNEKRYNATLLQWNGMGKAPRMRRGGGCIPRPSPPLHAPPLFWSDR